MLCFVCSFQRVVTERCLCYWRVLNTEIRGVEVEVRHLSLFHFSSCVCCHIIKATHNFLEMQMKRICSSPFTLELYLQVFCIIFRETGPVSADTFCVCQSLGDCLQLLYHLSSYLSSIPRSPVSVPSLTPAPCLDNHFGNPQSWVVPTQLF